MKVLLACERSAGHIFPALSMAKKFKKSGKDVRFFITSDFFKSRVEKEGFKTVGRSFAFRNLALEGLWRFFEALYFIIVLRPKKVIGFGGRDSFFLVLLSSFLFIDTAVYELNVAPGKANKALFPFVRRIFRGFEEKELGPKQKVVGVPLRENIKRIDKGQARKILNFDEKPVVLCLGGSQGSSFVNDIFMKFAQNFKEGFQIAHLTGQKEYSDILRLYDKISNNKFIKDFYYEMELLYSAADIVISRAGANTLGEIAYYKLPCILIPHPGGGAHQKKNAFYFEEKGAAFVCSQDDFSFEKFSALLSQLIKDAGFRESVGNNLSGIKLGVNFEDFCDSICL